MLGNPALLLRLRPVSARAARQDDWMEMRNCLEQVTRVRQQWQGGIEVARLGKPLPEGWQTMALLECARRHTEDMLGRSEEHTSELQSLLRISYAVFGLKKTNHEH